MFQAMTLRVCQGALLALVVQACVNVPARADEGRILQRDGKVLATFWSGGGPFYGEEIGGARGREEFWHVREIAFEDYNVARIVQWNGQEKRVHLHGFAAGFFNGVPNLTDRFACDVFNEEDGRTVRLAWKPVSNSKIIFDPYLGPFRRCRRCRGTFPSSHLFCPNDGSLLHWGWPFDQNRGGQSQEQDPSLGHLVLKSGDIRSFVGLAQTIIPKLQVQYGLQNEKCIVPFSVIQEMVVGAFGLNCYLLLRDGRRLTGRNLTFFHRYVIEGVYGNRIEEREQAGLIYRYRDPIGGDVRQSDYLSLYDVGRVVFGTAVETVQCVRCRMGLPSYYPCCPYCGTPRTVVNGRMVELRDAEDVREAKPGLCYAAYSGQWEKLPHFAALTPTAKGTVPTFGVGEMAGKDWFGLKFTGYLDVPTDGVYGFATSSDDGSRLWIGDRLVVDNDGLHSVAEQRGVMGLKAGKHPIKVEFFDATVDEELKVFYKGPGGVLQEIPASALWWREEAPLPKRASENVQGLAPGLSFRLLEGRWERLPDLRTIQSVDSGTMSTFGVGPVAGRDWLALEIEGYVEVPADGVYHFFTKSDDGSRLWIGDRLVVDNDGLHGASECGGSIHLAAGKHPIRVAYFEAEGDEILSVSCEGPGIEKREIPASALWRRPPGK